MTTPLYPKYEKRIADATDRLLHVRVDPWSQFNTGHPIRLTTFDGRTIAYEGGGFEGSPRHVLWSRYIDPFLEDLAVCEIRIAVEDARDRDVDARLLLPEIEGLLLASCRKVYARMAQIDQRLRGKGYPQSVPLRPIDRELEDMKIFVRKHVQAELAMWKGNPWYERWYSRNKFVVWALGTLVAAAGLAVKLL